MIAMPESIAAYQDECEAIYSWLTEPGWLHQDEFDRRSLELRYGNRPRRVHRYTQGTIILPFKGNPYLAILHEMQDAGLVEDKQDDTGISYRWRS